MRMIGHKVLQVSGDSQSLVMPVKKAEDTYRIAFQSDFAFSPDAVSREIDSIMLVSQASNHYTVEFIQCESDEVVYGYEANDSSGLNACRGRSYPMGCYELLITPLDRGSEGLSEASNSISSGVVLGGIAALLLAAFGGFFIARRAAAKGDPFITRIGQFVFDRRNMELRLDDTRIELTSKESDLLHLLRASANDTVEREDILKAVWQDDGDYVGRTLDVFVSKLRKKLEPDESVRIINIRGVGYKLVLND